MKRIILVSLFLTLISLANAQRLDDGSTYTVPFRPYWVAGINGGLSLYLAEGNVFTYSKIPHIFSLRDNGGSTERVELGYHFTPIFGVRGFLSITQHHWADIRYTTPDGLHLLNAFGSESLTADLMINLSNWWRGFNPNRLFNLSVFAGTGVVHRDKADFSTDNYSLCLRGGLQGDFRINENLKLNLIADGNIVNDNFNAYVVTFPVEIFTAFTVGLSYRLPERRNPDPTPEIEYMPRAQP